MEIPEPSESGQAHPKLQKVVEYAIGALALAAILYGVYDGSQHRPFARPVRPEPIDCAARFKAIQDGQLGPDVKVACASEFDKLIARISTSYSINGAAIRAGTKTVSLYGATVERIDSNPGGQLGKSSIPTVRIGHGSSQPDLDLQFGNSKEADAAFLEISTTLSKLK